MVSSLEIISRAAVCLQLTEHQYPDQLGGEIQTEERYCRKETVNLDSSFLSVGANIRVVCAPQVPKATAGTNCAKLGEEQANYSSRDSRCLFHRPIDFPGLFFIWFWSRVSKLRLQ